MKNNWSNNLSINLSIKYLEQYKNNITDDFSITKSFSFDENSFQEIEKSAIDRYIKKNQTEKNIPEIITYFLLNLKKNNIYILVKSQKNLLIIYLPNSQKKRKRKRKIKIKKEKQ